ncbi:hypothetical protein AK830_g1585 [Neonectria ditissima]|uniref:Uncharacterized protein n=1 Tax=Neonectria ditissima TaxID=78410 RepID=A0A0P7BE27_9HYPO|nr:hypothetical protein AK830_g1585 [Neonectria ditissima]
MVTNTPETSHHRPCSAALSATIGGLPNEILVHILNEMAWKEKLHVAQTSRSMAAIALLNLYKNDARFEAAAGKLPYAILWGCWFGVLAAVETSLDAASSIGLDTSKMIQTPVYAKEFLEVRLNRLSKNGKPNRGNYSIAGSRNACLLHIACIRGNTAIAELLIEKGSEVDYLNESGLTALHFSRNSDVAAKPCRGPPALAHLPSSNTLEEVQQHFLFSSDHKTANRSSIMDCLSSFLFCTTSQNNTAAPKLEPSEKAIITNQPVPYSDDAAGQIVEILRTAETSGNELEHRLKQVVSTNGWTENLAKSILRGVEKILKDGAKASVALTEAADKATNTAKEFAKKNPGYTILIAGGTLIALGILIMLIPWVLDALGFGAAGPRLGSFAADWMANIARSEAGHVTKKSLYSWLQRMGMTWV